MADKIFKKAPVGAAAGARERNLFLAGAVVIMIGLVVLSVFVVYSITRTINAAFSQAKPAAIPALKFDLESAEKLSKLNVGPPAMMPESPKK